MKNCLLRLALVAALATLSTAAQAQEKGDQAQIGVGISLSSSGFDLLSTVATGPMPVQIYVPINLGRFRIEPSVGFVKFDQSGGSKFSNFTLGVGGFLVNRPAAAFDTYVGARLNLGFVSEDNGTVSGSATDVSFMGALGAEWMPIPNFALGLEAQAGIVSGPSITSGPVSLRDSYTTLTTQGLLFLRAYL